MDGRKNLYIKLMYYMRVLLNSYSNEFLQVVEHQKSGGSWIAQILSHYYKIPFYSAIGQKIEKRGVVRLHARRQYSFRPKNQIYILRDGRDVLTSYYFHLFYRLKIPQIKNFANIQNVKENFARYLHMYFRKELGSRILWHSHADYWIPKVQCVIRYEDMLLDPYSTLSNAITALNGSGSIDSERLKESIEAYDFKNVAGRNRGQEDQGSFFRKGISGDWKNYFNYEAATVFDQYAGDKLIQFGYEGDKSWITRFQ